MQLGEVYFKIKLLNQPIFQTRDIVALLNSSTTVVSKSLLRLANFGHLVRLQRGLWAIPERINPLMLPEYLTAPHPSYVSLQSALYYHGMIEQIPEIVYAVTLARAKQFKTTFATVSVHHISAAFYFGFENIGENNIKMATSEKALLDFFYFSPAKTRIFANLPELEIPKNFDYKLCKEWLNKIPSLQRRTTVEKNLSHLKSHFKN